MSKRLLASVLATLVACGGSTKQTATTGTGTGTGGTTNTTTAATTNPAQTPADPDDAPLPLWPKVRRGVLPNGMTYYVMKHGKPEGRAMFWLAVNAGSVQEDDDQRGLAHFDEHMAFNGTKRFPKDAIVKYLETIGMKFGADLNAYTTWDQTVYQLEVPTDKPEFMGKGLDILRDWAGDVTYDPAEVAKERGVVKEEWRLGRGAQMRLFDKHAKVLYKGSRYADRITIGLPEILDKAPVDALKRFYKDWYRPDLMAVIAVGDFDPDKVEAEIKAKFGDLKEPANPRKRPTGGVPPANGTRVSIETDREMPQTVVMIENLIAHRPEASKRDYRRLLAEQLYTNVLNERLMTLARAADAPFMFAATQISDGEGTRDLDSFTRFAVAKQGKADDTLRVLLTEARRIEKHGITAGELERARTEMLRSYEQLADTEATRDSRQFTDEITRHFFEGELMVGSEMERKLALELVPKLTLAELNQLGASFGGENGRVILLSGPDGKPLPTKERVNDIVAEVTKANIEAWEDAAPTQALMEKTPTPGKILQETKNDKVGVTIWKLSNGARVIVKPTDFENDNVLLAAASPGGEATVKDSDYNNARWADQIVDLGGVGNFDTETLHRMLAGKRATVGTTIDETEEEIHGSASAKDVETMMQLLYLRTTAPRKDVEQFNVWKANFKEQLENAKRSPEFQYARESQKALWHDALRREPPEASDFDKVDIDKALAFYKNRFGDFTDFTFVIVGSVKLEELKPLVETYLASLPGKGRKEKEKDLKIRKVKGVVKKEYKLGTEPKASVSIEMHGPQKWTRNDDRDMSILSSVLAIKLRETLREDMGGVYGVRARGRISRSPWQERDFTVSFGCDPARVDELVKAVFASVDKLKKEDVDAGTLDRVKQTFIRGRETELRENDFWLGWLSSAYKYGDDPALVLDTTPVVERMTPANVKAAAKKFLDTKQYFEAVMLPEK
jgi:zinc protease